MLVTKTWDFLERNSTSEESASEFSLSVHDLFMRVNKAIRWGNLPSGSFMCVWKSFGLIHSQTFHSWAPAPVCQIHIDPHLCHQMWGIKVSPLYCSLIFSRIFANKSAQTHQWRGGVAQLSVMDRRAIIPQHRVLWYDYGSSLYMSYLDLNKMIHFRDSDWLSPESYQRFFFLYI